MKIHGFSLFGLHKKLTKILTKVLIYDIILCVHTIVFSIIFSLCTMKGDESTLAKRKGDKHGKK